MDESTAGTWTLLTAPEISMSSWEYGLWNLSGTEGVAEFTPDGAPDETQRVRYPVDAFSQWLPDGGLRTDLVVPPGSFTVVICSTPMDVEGTPQFVAVDPDRHLDCEDDS